MEITTSWVKPPPAIGGLDHLAVQAPCINLYGKMLPGITNVTDRARYYSFYPWVVWMLERRGHVYGDAFIDLFRKSDCLFTLIAERHAVVAGGDREDHAGATVGSGNMAAQIAKVRNGQSVILSHSAHREGENRYFKNKLGGLGQYYLGVFRELNIMSGDAKTGIKNIREIGGVIAETIESGVKISDLFYKTIKEDTVSAARLDELSSYCPCRLNASGLEHTKLLDLFFVSGQFYDQNALSRRRTLKLLLSLSENLSSIGVEINLEQFRGSTYSGALPNNTTWHLSDRLDKTRRQWAIYERNEILSLAVQGIFFVILDAYQESGKRFHSVDDLVRWFLALPLVEAVNPVFPLEAAVGAVTESTSVRLPAIADWTNEDHEVRLAARIEALCRRPKSEENRSSILLASLKALVALKSRPETREAYGEFVLPPHYLGAYPINLQTFNYYSGNLWDTLTVRQWISWLATVWGVNTHLFVALRKLRGQSQSTFRIRPSDDGLEIISVPEAVFTSPRFWQALRILKDVGAIERKDNLWVTSSLGKKLLEMADE